LGFSYDGPTELGGLVVVPEYRKHPAQLGRFVSFVRFLYIAAHSKLFQPDLLAELLPPLESDGTSHLWEALGRRLTNLSYSAADLLSSRNKDFIRDLFPGSAIYASVLSPEAQHVIGKVGDQSKGVERMLTKVGFRYAERVDPFDGGPHFVAKTAEVSAIARAQTLPFVSETENAVRQALVAAFSQQPPFVRAVRTACAFDHQGIDLPSDAARHLEVTPGAALTFLPLD
jgi:arginine N-succinyltransferase